MVIKENHRALLKQLKAQVKLLLRKEEQAKNELRAAIKKMRSMAKGYQREFTSNLRILQNKLAEAHAQGYAKAAIEIERQLLKAVERKAQAVAKVAAQMEKATAAKLAKRGKQSGKKRTR